MGIGVFGGTFDPIHLGHLIIAQEVMERLELSEIRFVPAAQPWMKKGREISSAFHRVKMLELSIVDNHRFLVDKTDLKRNGETYTVDTLRDLKKQLGEETELFLILGVDALKGFTSWKEPGEIIKLATLVAVPRPGYRIIKLSNLEKEVPGIGSKIIVLEEPLIGISGLDIRRRVRKGKSIKYLVATGVSKYIKENRLYLNTPGD